MGRPKVKEKKPPPLASSKDASATGDNEDSSAPSNLRKRGRPRKTAQDEMDREGSTEIASLNENDLEKKRTWQKDSGAPSLDEKGDANGVSFDGKFQPTTAKRDGNRRKGNPRRAAGASLDFK